MRIILVSIFLVLLLSVASYGDESIVVLQNELTWKVYRELREPAQNIVFSPIDLFSNLIHVYAGARGETRAEISRAFGFEDIFTDYTANALHMGYELDRYLALLEGQSHCDGYRLKRCNSMWVHEGYEIATDYSEYIKLARDMDLRHVDFTSGLRNVSEQLGRWAWACSQEGSKLLRIKDLWSRDTRVLIISMMDFKGTWAQPFDLADTRDDEFHVSESSICTVQMMHQKQTFILREYDEVRILELQYSSGSGSSSCRKLANRLSFFILLPRLGISLSDIENKLTGSVVTEWLSEKGYRYADIYIPQFSIARNYKFKKIFEDLGVSRPFSTDEADFSGINDKELLYVCDIYQNSFISIDEEGTTARSLGAVRLDLLGSPEYSEFRVDHPFIFFIRDNDSGLVLLAGRVINPEDK